MLASILIGLVALLHVGFAWLEMVAWDTPLGHKIFARPSKKTAQFMREAKPLAANQGLYNLFLAAGLAWGLYLGDAGFATKVFFLACVVVAGLFGAATVSTRILYLQAAPAALALIALWLGW